MRNQFVITPDPETNQNVLDLLLDKIFPTSPRTKSIIKFLVRLLGYGVLTYFGIDVAS